MGISYDDSANSGNNKPPGHFPDPDPENKNVTIKYDADLAITEYWICLAEVVEIVDNNNLRINLFKKNGKRGGQVASVDLNNLGQVWRALPSTIDQNVANQPPLKVKDCVVLCVTDKVANDAGISAPKAEFQKHPWAGGVVGAKAALREMTRYLKDKITSGDLPATAALMANYPWLFT
jgi:hypothetical protein